MKKILVTGEHSFIGNSFAQFMGQWPGYGVTKISLRDGGWKDIDFKDYDVVYHVSGIAHRKETVGNAKEYFDINRDLPVQVAEKAKRDGAGQFIFLSSGAVYGTDMGSITKDTEPRPVTNYGRSKLEAEAGLEKLRDGSFKVVILRPLMVYGKGCRGNFQRVVEIAGRSPVFPMAHNQRSLIHVDNLSSFVKLAIDEGLSGLYFPKNREEADIYEMVRCISECLGKRVYMSRALGRLVSLAKGRFGITRKAFGDMVYCGLEAFDYRYCVVGFRESIRKSISP